jgi:hypothetical protein
MGAVPDSMAKAASLRIRPVLELGRTFVIWTGGCAGLRARPLAVCRACDHVSEVIDQDQPVIPMAWSRVTVTVPRHFRAVGADVGAWQRWAR